MLPRQLSSTSANPPARPGRSQAEAAKWARGWERWRGSPVADEGVGYRPSTHRGASVTGSSGGKLPRQDRQRQRRRLRRFGLTPLHLCGGWSLYLNQSQLLVNAETGKVRSEPRCAFQSALDRCSRPRKRYAAPSDKINAPATATSTKSLRGMNGGKRWEL